MLSTQECRRMLNGVFEEEALIIGGLAALHQPDDDFIWRLVKSLEAVRERALEKLNGKPVSGCDSSKAAVDLRPHPAVVEFLLNIRKP